MTVVSVGTALANEASEIGPLGPGVPTSEDLISAIENGPPGLIAPIPTDPGAAEGVDLSDAGRERALEVLEGVFGQHLGEAPPLPDDAYIDDLLTANVAILPSEEESTAVPAEASNHSEQGAESVEPAPAGTQKSEMRGEHAPAPPESDEYAEVTNSALLESSTPLAVSDLQGSGEIVDLELERTSEAIEPSSPLVELRIPSQLGEGIALPDVDVRMRLAEAPAEREPSLIDDRIAAAYPNVANDTDFAVVPTPTGFETFTQLRTAASPRTQTFALDMPVDAELVADEIGGAAVVKGDETLVSVSPPTAIDAAGTAVPVDLNVDGDRLIIAASPGPSTAYPVLVDPLFQTYDWEKMPNWESGICNSSFEWHSFNQCNYREEWGYEHIEQGGSPLDIDLDNQFWGTAPLYVPQGTPGIYIHTSNTLTAGDRGTVLYTVPRYFTDQSESGQRPTSYIQRMTLSKLLWQAYSGGLSPYLFAGLWDPIKPGWVSYYTHTGETGHGVSDMAYQYKFVNGQENGGGIVSNSNTNVKVGQVSVQATETRSASNTHAYVGYASVELADDLPPAAPIVSAGSAWVDQTAAPLSFTASDSGLGVFELTAVPEGSASPVWTASYGCIGVSGAPCPRIWKSSDSGHEALTYQPAQLSTGVHYLEVKSKDPVGNTSAAAFAQVKVDHAAPEVSLAGSLTEQESLGRKRPSYTLRVDAVDGSPEEPQSGIVKIVIRVDGVVVDEYESGCSAQSCGASREWTLQSEDYSEGSHSATVVATDAVGRTKTATLGFWLEPSPPVLELSGTLTEQEEVGTSRPRYSLQVDAEAVAGVEGAGSAEPTFQSAFGSLGAGAGQFSHPAGIAVDASGNLWVVDQENDRVQKFNSDGEHLLSFGSSGSGDGQFGRPTDIAIDAAGNLWITDAANRRVEKFSPTGQFLMKFGSAGEAPGQLSGAESIAIDANGDIWIGDTYNGRLQKFNAAGEFLQVVGSRGTAEGQMIEPTGIDIGPKGDIWVADWGNQRVSVFSEDGQFVRQFGSPGSGEGQFARPDVIEVDASGNVWVGDQNNDRIQQFSESGEYIAQFGSTGSGDEQFNFGWPMGIASDSKGNLWISDTWNHRVQRWTVDGSRSEISITVRVDGATVSSSSARCDSARCSKVASLVLDAADMSFGNHDLEVIATDGLGNLTQESRSFAVDEDLSAPTIDVTGSLAAAPEGWVEQRNYSLEIDAQDAGYGVTSMRVAIDGDEVAADSQTCVDGGCAQGLAATVDTSAYEGGAHTVEATAEDGAGNERSSTWTMNVDPQGNISTEEAAATLEALAETADVNPVGPSETEPDVMGSAAGLTFEESAAGLEATGTAVPTTVAGEPVDGLTMEVLPDEYMSEPCEEEFTDPDEEAELAAEQDLDPEEPAEITESCPLTESEESAELAAVSVEPDSIASGATSIEVIDGSAALASNTSDHVDTITRPLYEGSVTFASIRDAEAPEEFSWHVELEPGQELKLADEQHAVVYYEGGHPAFSVSAEPAHDAVGSPVPTRLDVSEDDVVTLIVEHRQGGVVYPVLSGAGWRGGFTSTEVIGPKDEQELLEERERILEEEREAREAEEAAEGGEEVSVPHVLQSDQFLGIRVASQGPPVLAGRVGPDGNQVQQIIFAKKFKFNECFYDIGTGDLPVPNLKVFISDASEKCRKHIGWTRLEAGLAVHGWFRIDKILDAVWIKPGNLHCRKWGKDQPALVHCKKEPNNNKSVLWPDVLHVQADFRFYPGDGPSFTQPPPGLAGTSACVTIGGNIRYGDGAEQEETEIRPARQGDPCPWP